MARPRVPLISRRLVLEAALRIIDTEGLDALSMRRLARELNVNGASFYHHFKSKNEILIGAALLALDEVRVNVECDSDWRDWLVDNCRAYREGLRAHPALIPVLHTRHPVRLGLAEHDASAATLVEQGVPPGAVMPLMNCLEALVIGSVLFRSAVADDRSDEWEETFPHLTRAVASTAISSDDVFDIGCRAIVQATMALVESVMEAEPAQQRQPPSRRATGAST